MTAAKNADAGAIRALLAQRVDVNAHQADGTTALHWAAYRNDTSSAEALVRAGAIVNNANALGATPLWAACENGSRPMVRLLLDAGADPNLGLPSGETPLMTAARGGSADVVKALVDKGADVNASERTRGQTALMWAAAQQHPQVVRVLIAAGADVHARSAVWTQVVKLTPEAKNAPYTADIQQGGFTPLMFAARAGDAESTTLLLDAGANVNATPPYGTTALVIASHAGHTRVAEILLERGADPNNDEAGYTALHIAVRRKNEALVGMLLARKADPNAWIFKATPARRGSEDIYIAPSFIGAKPFWLAARVGAPRIMQLLADADADPLYVHHLAYWSQAEGYELRRVVEGDTTALMAAVGMGDDLRPADEATTHESVRLAVAHGIDVNAANHDGDTALHAAATRGYNSVVRLLVENGARLDIKNNAGKSPIDVIDDRRSMAGTRELMLELLAKAPQR